MEKKQPQCCIERCLTKTKSIKVKDIIYYLFPTDADWANKWEKQIKDFDPTYRRRSNDIVCSLHFAKSSMQPVSRQLVDHALPIYFPQKAPDSQRTKIAETVSVQKIVKPVPDSTSADSKCCITGCPTKFDDTEPKIHGFRFPDGSEQRKKWIFIIELYNNQKIEWTKSMRICALHFNPSCFVKDDELCADAKPSIFKHAIVCRQKEIAKQQTQSNNQQPSPTKVQSINVPLHKQQAENHSMTRRSAPIIARRLSLPFSKLPPLIPRPNMLKRVNPNNLNVTSKIQRVSLPNGIAAQPSVNVTVKRPVPALAKVNVIANPQFIPKGSTVLRKSMPAPAQMNKLPPAIIARLDNGTAKLIPLTKPVSATAHITRLARLPPTLKPAPRPVVKTIPKGTHAESPMPKISLVQSIAQPVAKENSTPIISKVSVGIATLPSNPVVEERRNPDVIVIDDEEVEMARAMKTSEDIDGSNGTAAAVQNGDEMQIYRVKDEKAFQYPRILLQRILEKKRQNELLTAEVAKWKKIAYKMNQTYRLQKATTSTETIDIS